MASARIVRDVTTVVAENAEVTSEEGVRYCNRALQVVGIEDNTPLAWGADSKTLAFVAGNKAISVADLPGDGTMTLRVSLAGHRNNVLGLEFHPSEPLLISCGVEGIFIWDLAIEALRARLTSYKNKNAHEGQVESVCWLHDGHVLATGGKDSAVKLWDGEREFAAMHTLFGHKAAVMAIQYNGERNIMATAGRDSAIILWDVAVLAPSERARREDDLSLTATALHTIDAHRGDIVSLAFSHGGALMASGARDNVLKVWDTATGTSVVTMRAHRGDVRAMAFVGESMLQSASADGTIKLWDLPFAANWSKRVKEADKDEIDFLGDSDSEEAAEDVLTPELIMTLPAHDSDVMRMKLSPDGQTMATSSSQDTVRVWDVSTIEQPKLVHEFVGHTAAVNRLLLIHQNQRFLSASTDFRIHLYDLETTVRTAGMDFHGSVLAMAVHPNQLLVFAGGKDYVIKAYSLVPNVPETFKVVANLVGHSGAVEALAMSPDGTMLVSAAHDFDLRVWKIQDAYTVDEPNLDPVVVSKSNVFSAHQGHCMALEFSGDGTYMASGGSDHRLIVWKPTKRGSLNKFWEAPEAHDASICAVTFIDSKDLVVSASNDQTLRLWKVSEKGKSKVPVRTLTGHGSRITAVQSTPDDKFLVSACSNASIRLWDLQDGGSYACIAEYDAVNDGAILSLAVAKEKFLSGSENGVIRAWPFPGGERDAWFTDKKPQVLFWDPVEDMPPDSAPPNMETGEPGVSRRSSSSG